MLIHGESRREGDDRPYFLITIDTEGDNIWAQPKEVTTNNARYLPRFQALSERYGFKPTYLTDFDMVRSGEFCEFARDALTRGTAEVGMHLHAWNSPPFVPLTSDDLRWQPYLIEYPEAVMREKVRSQTGLLEDTFQRKMLSHRAGRWSFNATYARILIAEGYTSDCSVTPLVSWRGIKGSPDGEGGTDYTGFPSAAYFMDPDNIASAGSSQLIEIPLTVMSLQPDAVQQASGWFPEGALVRRALNRFFPRAAWLRPRGDNRAEMLRILKRAREERRDYVEFMLHSSEFMPGGSPTFPGGAHIDALYRDLEVLFETASRHFRGGTLTEYRAVAAAAADRSIA